MKGKTLRIAVVGSGPAGMYAIEHLLKEPLNIEIDLYERLPTPWGLVRYGVAPDHPEKKLIIDRAFNYYLAHPKVRFIGNLEIGKDIDHTQLSEWYSAVIYAVGATEDKSINIPGESLPGSWAAREFVAWYNGHPDFSHLEFDLSCERAVVVGNGNVALDVARILTMSPEQLAKTDISQNALEALKRSKIREVVILGRSNLVKAAFHNPELEELACLDGVDIVLDKEQLPKKNNLNSALDWKTKRKILTLNHLAKDNLKEKNRKIIFRFMSSPIELIGSNKLERLVVAKNQIDFDEEGRSIVRPTEESYQLETGILFRAIGYRGIPLPGLPFNKSKGVIENIKGRVSDQGELFPGTYVTGWIKNGPRGIIGTNKLCARDTVRCLLQDAKDGKLSSNTASHDEVLTEVKKRKATIVEYANWLNVERTEIAAGSKIGRPRLKLTKLDDLLEAAGV